MGTNCAPLFTDLFPQNVVQSYVDYCILISNKKMAIGFH